MKGILFSTEMSAAIRDGRKTQTRRLMKPQPDQAGYVANDFKVPFTKGDILYVREEHYAYGVWQPNGFTASGRKKWKFKQDSQFKEVRFAENPPAVIQKNSQRVTGWYKRLGRFMPKAYARTFLEVTDIGAHRIQDISQDDAKAEGIEFPAPHRCGGWVNPLDNVRDCYKCPFKVLWNKINGEAGNGWDQNQWVFAYTFKHIKKPSNG